jgi:hypothetical protein
MLESSFDTPVVAIEAKGMEVNSGQFLDFDGDDEIENFHGNVTKTGGQIRVHQKATPASFTETKKKQQRTTLPLSDPGRTKAQLSPKASPQNSDTRNAGAVAYREDDDVWRCNKRQKMDYEQQSNSSREGYPIAEGGVPPFLTQLVGFPLVQGSLSPEAFLNTLLQPNFVANMNPHQPQAEYSSRPKEDPPADNFSSPMYQQVEHPIKKLDIPEEHIASLNLGQEFLSRMEGAPSRLCDCGMTLCYEIGYPNAGRFEFPEDPAIVQQWCQALDITGNNRIRSIMQSPSKFHVAYWHFRKEHRSLNARTGQWTRLWGNISYENTHQNQATIIRAIPDAHLQSFIDDHEEELYLQSSVRRRAPSSRSIQLHNYWISVRRPPTLDP